MLFPIPTCCRPWFQSEDNRGPKAPWQRVVTIFSWHLSHRHLAVSGTAPWTCNNSSPKLNENNEGKREDMRLHTYRLFGISPPQNILTSHFNVYSCTDTNIGTGGDFVLLASNLTLDFFPKNRLHK